MIEDMFYYKGLPMKSLPFGDKLGYIQQLMENLGQEFIHKDSIVFTLPFMWEVQSTDENSIISFFNNNKHMLGYNTHHLQVRKLNHISPYLNILLHNMLSKINQQKNISVPVVVQNPKHNTSINLRNLDFNPDFSKSQYRMPTVFQVTADIQFDVYHLYAYGKHNTPIYCGVAGIPTLKTSMFMNSIFRKIKENQNIDFIEESDDEDDFQNISEDKYVDLSKVILIECTFNTKFKKWVPCKVVPNKTNIVHISRLVSNPMY